mmetsp:Transcript_22789/g.58233  ORF Transcript_22789/g.58233 Transcript_22789/m.58233 type:complete len:210 (-) Transcript_22789:512-1141(-)
MVDFKGLETARHRRPQRRVRAILDLHNPLRQQVPHGLVQPVILQLVARETVQAIHQVRHQELAQVLPVVVQPAHQAGHQPPGLPGEAAVVVQVHQGLAGVVDAHGGDHTGHLHADVREKTHHRGVPLVVPAYPQSQHKVRHRQPRELLPQPGHRRAKNPAVVLAKIHQPLARHGQLPEFHHRHHPDRIRLHPIHPVLAAQAVAAELVEE